MRPVAGAEIGVAEAGRHDPDENLTTPRVLDLDLFENERLMIGGQHRRGGSRHVTLLLFDELRRAKRRR